MPKRFVLLACSVAFLSCFLVESQEVCPDKAPSLIKWSEWALAKAVTSNTTVITIPAGVSILFDMPAAPSFFSFGGILVDGSLILQDNGADGANVELHTQYVIARDGGSIIAGSECCPYQGQLDIVLYGDKSEADVENLGTKVLGATRGGSLSLHGQVATPTWTSLAATAVKGSSEIVLSEPVNWKVGDNLVLPSTDFDMKQVDGGAIKAISADKKTISLDFKLKYMHFGEIVGVGKSHDDSVDERGEVGHLSRRINVRGAQDAGNKIGFGGHIMARDDFKLVQLSGVQVSFSGQKGVLGRYPVHFHMAGNKKGRAYVRDCALVFNHQRALTLHAINGVDVSRNVAFSTNGHMFFIEDGIEQDNTFSYNLAILALPHDLLPSDKKAACYWITNPLNNFVHNVAAGCQTFGFWWALPKHPLGPSFNISQLNRQMPVQLFQHNKAHSTDTGLHVDDAPKGLPGGSLAANDIEQYNYDPLDPLTKEPVFTKFEAFTAYKCRGRGVWMRGKRCALDGGRFADNAIALTFAENSSHLGRARDLYMHGESNNVGQANWNGEQMGPLGRSISRPWEPDMAIRGYEFYDGPNSLSNARCSGFQPNPQYKASCVSMLRKDKFSISTLNSAHHVATFDNSTRIGFVDHQEEGDFNSIFKDVTGSLTGRPGVIVTAINPLLQTPNCIDRTADWQVFLCPDHFAHLQITNRQFTTTVFDHTDPYDAVIYRDDLPARGRESCGSGESCFERDVTKLETITHADQHLASVVLQNHYTVEFNHATPNDITVRLANTEATHAATGDSLFVQLKICFPPNTVLTSAVLNYSAKNTKRTDTLAGLDALESGVYYDIAKGWFYAKLHTTETRSEANMYQSLSSNLDLKMAVTDSTRQPCPRDAWTAFERPLPPLAPVATPPAFAAPPPVSKRYPAPPPACPGSPVGGVKTCDPPCQYGDCMLDSLGLWACPAASPSLPVLPPDTATPTPGTPTPIPPATPTPGELNGGGLSSPLEGLRLGMVLSLLSVLLI